MNDAVVALEVAEREAFADLYRSAGPDVVSASGLAVAEVAGAALLVVNRIDVLALNRLVGLGLHAPVSDATLTEVLDAFAQAGSTRFFVPVAPVGDYEELQMRLEQRRLRQYNNWMRLSRSVKADENLPDPAPNLTIRRIDTTASEPFGRIVAEGFGYPPSIAPLAAQAIGRPGWHHYLAYEGDVPIAAAAMHVTGEAAWFGFEATEAAYRRRGAQQALVVRQIKDAASLGCRWISVETAEDTITRDAPSFRNLRRLGFEVAYRRPNYIWLRASS